MRKRINIKEKMEKLKPCPFCGDEPAMHNHEVVYCDTFQCPMYDMRTSLSLWDARPALKEEWISVKERLPEILEGQKFGWSKNVLAFDGPDITVASYNYDNRGGSEWWCVSGNDINPTHWMSLPSPPTK